MLFWMFLAISLSMESDIILKISFWESGWVYFCVSFGNYSVKRGSYLDACISIWSKLPSLFFLHKGRPCLLKNRTFSRICRSIWRFWSFSEIASPEIISEALRFVSRRTSMLSASLWHFDFSCAWNFFTAFVQLEKPSVRKAPSFLLDSLMCPDRLCDLHIEQRTTSFPINVMKPGKRFKPFRFKSSFSASKFSFGIIVIFRLVFDKNRCCVVFIYFILGIIWNEHRIAF